MSKKTQWVVLAPYRAWYEVGTVEAETEAEALRLAGEIECPTLAETEPWDLPELLPEAVEVEAT